MFLAAKKHRILTADLQHAKDRNVNSTPVTFVVDNQTGQVQMLKGAQPAEVFVSTIQ